MSQTWNTSFCNLHHETKSHNSEKRPASIDQQNQLVFGQLSSEMVGRDVIVYRSELKRQNVNVFTFAADKESERSSVC